jgi:hypothetical protein
MGSIIPQRGTLPIAFGFVDLFASSIGQTAADRVVGTLAAEFHLLFFVAFCLGFGFWKNRGGLWFLGVAFGVDEGAPCMDQ